MVKQKAKKWYQSKTVIVALLVGIVGVLTAISSEQPDIGWVVSAQSALMVILRFMTKDEVKF